MSLQVSLGLKIHEQGFSGSSKFPGHIPKDSNEMEKWIFPQISWYLYPKQDCSIKSEYA